jgi:uncharacterized membrane protein YraQ (UPF0718 family)
MSTASITSHNRFRLNCYYRPLILGLALVAVLCVFWIASRYPQLWSKSQHIGADLATMAYGKAAFPIVASAPWYERLLYGALNWLDSMKIGMTFGVTAGALLHTILKYYPLKIGNNLTLNSLKGALIGLPAGVCTNCAVPVACGVTRGHGRIEVALGFLFSSPNFNPIVVMMTITALPWQMVLAKYLVLALVIAAVVPGLIGLLQRQKPFKVLTFEAGGESCALPDRNTPPCDERFFSVATELVREFLSNVWMILKPTIVIMLCASIGSAILLEYFPWDQLLANPTPGKLFLASCLSTLMPVPIALDVLFAALLLKQGVAMSYVMVFAMTLGTYSIVPSIFLWREVSKRFSVLLFLFFVLTGWLLGLCF